MRRLLVLLCFLAAGVAPAGAQTRCPANFAGRAEAVACTCTAEDTRSGGVWGSGPYTTDSRVCRAALHAGAIAADGGLIHVFPAPGEAAYRGSTANGVTSQDYGAWGGSFTVVAPGATAGRPLAPCPETLRDPKDAAGPFSCSCTPGAAAGGQVWGSGVYTSDSRICRAALHAGIIPATGGSVAVTPAPGRPSYDASTANGVASSRYGAWSSSFTVAAITAPPPPRTAEGPAECPASFQGRSAPLACTCTPAATASGPVWGTGVYTTDSRICRAAIHAGVIAPAGGVVNVMPVPGLPSYFGSAQNGVTSSNYGSWGSSFTFRR